MKTLNLTEAAQFLKLHPEEVRRRAKAGIIPGAKLGKRWAFIEDDLADHIRSLYACTRQALQVGHEEKKLCHSLNAVKRGGFDSPHQAASALDALLQQKTKTQAQEFHDKLKAEAWRVAKAGEKPKYTWDEAAYKWLMETQHKKTQHDDVSKISWLQQFFRGKYLHEITREEIARIGELKLKTTTPATANRLLALIRSIFRRATFEWEWIDKVPTIKLYREPKRRVRYLSVDEANKLIQELPVHLADIVQFSLATGLRRANVTKLEWSQVDMQRNVAWIHGDQAKAGKPIHVSLNSTAMDVLARQIGKHPKTVFTYKGKSVIQVNTRAWRKALKRAGIEDFRWHDLRHTWASWLTQNGVPLNVIQEMGAWESAEMVRRYAHLAPAQFAAHARVVDAMFSGTNLTQSK